MTPGIIDKCDILPTRSANMFFLRAHTFPTSLFSFQIVFVAFGTCLMPCANGRAGNEMTFRQRSAMRFSIFIRADTRADIALLAHQAIANNLPGHTGHGGDDPRWH